MSDCSQGTRWTDDPATFTSALDDLKSEGCLLLVLEVDGDDAGGAGCRRMLGSDALGDRRRLFVLGDANDRDVAATDAAQRALVYRTGARSTAARPAPATPASETATHPDPLGHALEAEVEALAPVGGYEPGQLRVCVDTLGDVLDEDDLVATLEFLQTLRAAVHDADGIAHVHVDQQVPAIAVEGLLPQFDAVVEVADGDDPRQRWHLPEESLSTAWLEL
jgi:hypothetical protein